MSKQKQTSNPDEVLRRMLSKPPEPHKKTEKAPAKKVSKKANKP